MAQEVFVLLIDDLDGSGADETILFTLDGAEYEIDLNAKNAAALRKALDKYIARARASSGPTVGAQRRSSARRGSKAHPDPKAVRAWAQETGIEIKSRGRIPAYLIDLYRAAGNT